MLFKTKHIYWLTCIASIGFVAIFCYNYFFIQKEKKSFVKWYEQKHILKDKYTGKNKYPVHIYEHTSKELMIDSIYRSMMGPFSVDYVNLDTKSTNKFLTFLQNLMFIGSLVTQLK